MFFKKKRKGDEPKKLFVRVDDVYIATSNLKANCNDGKGFYEKKVTLFYLAFKVSYGYKELFTGRDLCLDEDEEFLDIPFIQKVEPLRDYLGDYEQEEISYTALFDIIATINAMVKLGSLENTKKGRKRV
ncbi:MAG: hypothetical protein IKL08_01945 [Clostridia bacterium]|nr:hypothetical protein [Clostridia bacterium]